MHAPFARGARARAAAGVLATLLVGLLSVEAFAQTPFVPYYGKNRIRYDTFDWHIYQTDHFEIYYYPEIEQHLERVAGYAESAYQHISADLKHDLAFKVPLLLYKTQSEFQQQNVIPTELPEGVLAFAEPYKDRMVLPIDEPTDQLFRLITHELTHIFEFDIIPRSLIRRGVPLWVDEGLSDYMAGYWNPLDLMVLRDAALADIVPKMSEFETEAMVSGRLPYLMGHAAFEFIEERWGKEGLRQFLFSLRKSVVGGGENAYEEAFRISAREFDQEFDRYLKDRFRPFRDFEQADEYGLNIAPKPNRTPFVSVISIEPSPSGDLLAVAAGNRKDQELDIVLVSSKDGQVIRNLTSGFDKDRGFEYIATAAGQRFNTVPWMAWSPAGDRLAYFVRTEKHRSLVLQNVVTRKVEQRVEIKTLDAPESPDIDPTGRYVAFSALNQAVGDIYLMDLTTEEITNLTNDEFAEYAPSFSPDGKSIVFMTRVSGNDKLFLMDLATKTTKQLTFGTHDDSSPQYLDDDTVMFISTATDPNEPVDPEVARNGQIFNVWTLDLRNGELKRFTNMMTGILSPVVLRETEGTRVAFISYHKGDWGIHAVDRAEPQLTVASSDFGGPGPIIDFQAPLQHTLIPDNARKKGAFEKMFLEGRPPVNVGITSSGDLFGGTAITFSDVLGDKQFNLYIASISQYRTFAGSYVNLSRRFNYAIQGYSQTQFYYGVGAGYLYDPSLAFIDRDFAIATRTARGGSIFGIYPLNRYARLEVSGGVAQYSEKYNDPVLEELAENYQEAQYGTRIFRDGTFVPLGVTFVQETTVFREYGPVAGNTVRIGYEIAPKIGNTLSRQTVDADGRYYMRLGTNGVLALRARGFKSWGEFPDFTYFGGNSELRGYEYLQFLGHRTFFLNAELRFPLIEAMLTPIGVMGGIRGVFYFGVGAACLNGAPCNVFQNSTQQYPNIIDWVPDFEQGIYVPVYGPPIQVSGFRLEDGRASYGVGLETFALGFPIHFDWSYRTLFNKDWEDVIYSAQGGSSAFRKVKFAVWIGYDF